ncbi:Electron transport complex protein RnfA, partial [Haemophilus influenzae]
FTGLVK